MVKQTDESILSFDPKKSRYRSGNLYFNAGLIVTAFIFCYAGVIWTMAGQWWSNDMYSYGFLIPGISLYLVWMQKQKLVQLSPHPDYIGGFSFFLAGMAMLLFGKLEGVTTIQELSLIITLVGVLFLLLGRHYLRVLCLPVSYLLLMLPVWDLFTERLHLPFQLFSADLGVKLLHLVGIPAFQQDKIIQLPNITLEVAKACSGVNYLIAVIVIGIPAAYFFLKDPVKRVLLVIFSMAVAVVSNGFRVALIGFLSYHGIGGNIHGPFHILQGLFVSVVGYGAIAVGIIVLSRMPTFYSFNHGSSWTGNGVPGFSEKPGATIHIKKEGLARRTKNISYITVGLSICLLLMGIYYFLNQTKSDFEKSGLKRLPFAFERFKNGNVSSK